MSSAISSKNATETEELVFDLGAMGKVSGRQVSILAARMAKLRAAADENSLPETYGTKVEVSSPSSNSRAKTTTASLTWNKTRASTSKFSLKRSPVQGKAMSLSEMLAGGGAKLKSASGSKSSSISKDSKEAFKDALKAALTGGLKLKSVVKDASSNENGSGTVNFGARLKSTHSSSVDGTTSGTFLSDNPILQKMRAKALEREEAQRRAEEEERARSASVPVVNVAVETSLNETLVEQIINPVSVSASVVSSDESSGGDMLSSLLNTLTRFNIQQNDTSSEDSDDWDDGDDDSLPIAD